MPDNSKSDMRFCKKCKKDVPKTKWKKCKSTINGKMYYRAYCNPCLNKKRLALRMSKPNFKAYKADRNRRYYLKYKQKDMPDNKQGGWEFELEALIMHYKEHRAADDDFKSFISNLLSKERERVIKEVEGMKKEMITDRDIRTLQKDIGYNRALSDVLEVLKDKSK